MKTYFDGEFTHKASLFSSGETEGETLCGKFIKEIDCLDQNLVIDCPACRALEGKTTSTGGSKLDFAITQENKVFRMGVDIAGYQRYLRFDKYDLGKFIEKCQALHELML